MQLIERDACTGSAGHRRVALLALPVFDNVPRLRLVRNLEVVARFRHTLQAQHFHRRRRRRVFHRATMIVEHCAHFAEHRAANEEVTRVQSPVLYQDGGNWPATLVDPRFQNRPSRWRVRIRLQLAQIRHEQQRFQ